MRFLAPLALGLAAAATTNPVLFVHVGKTCGGSAVAYLRRAVNVTEVHLRPVKREEVERASHIIVSVRDPTERVVSAFEWHRPGGDRTYGRCFHRKRDVERYGNSCADDELYKCAATADAFADLVASRNTTDRCARVAKAFLAPDAGARLLGELGWKSTIRSASRVAVSCAPLAHHTGAASHINRGFAFYLGEDTLDRLKGRRVWVVEASACERDARAFLAGLSLHQGRTFPTAHRQGPHALSYRRRAAIMDALAHEYRTLQALAKRAENYALDARRRAPAWAFAQRVLVRRVDRDVGEQRRAGARPEQEEWSSLRTVVSARASTRP